MSCCVAVCLEASVPRLRGVVKGLVSMLCVLVCVLACMVSCITLRSPVSVFIAVLMVRGVASGRRVVVCLTMLLVVSIGFWIVLPVSVVVVGVLRILKVSCKPLVPV